MALKAEISEIVASMTPPKAPGFCFGTINELNNLADNVSSFPAVFMLALQPVTSLFTVNNSLNNVYSIYLEFLFKVELDTNTDQCEAYDAQAMDLVSEFLIRLKNYQKSPGQKFFLIDVNDKGISQQIFNKYDTNTVGRNLTIDLKTTYNKQLCF